MPWQQVPDIEQPVIEQSSTELSCNPVLKEAINPLTKLNILYTNPDQLQNKMDDLSLLMNLTWFLLPKYCWNVVLYLLLDSQSMVIKHFSTLILILTSLLKQYVVVGTYVSNKLSVSEVTFNGYPHHDHIWIFDESWLTSCRLCISKSFFWLFTECVWFV